MKLSDQTKIEAQLGGLIGTMIGMVGIAVVIMIVATYGFWFKFFFVIGMGCALLMQLMQLVGLINMRKNYLEGVKMVKVLEKESEEAEKKRHEDYQKEYDANIEAIRKAEEVMNEDNQELQDIPPED